MWYSDIEIYENCCNQQLYSAVECTKGLYSIGNTISSVQISTTDSKAWS